MVLRHTFVLALAAVSTAYGSAILFSNQNAWTTAAGSFVVDDLSSAPVGGPLSMYDSPAGVTIRRSIVNEDNGQVRTRTVDFRGDTRISGQPYNYFSSSNAVYLNPYGPVGPGDK